MSRPCIKEDVGRTWPGCDAKPHHDGDVAGLLHDHHSEGDEDVGAATDDDERNDDEGDFSCSSLRARKELRGSASIQLVVMEALVRRPGSISAPIRGGAIRLSTLKLMTESRSGSSKRRCASARRVKAQLAS